MGDGQGHVWPNMCTGPVETVNRRVQAYIAETMEREGNPHRRMLFANFSDIFLQASPQIVYVRSWHGSLTKPFPGPASCRDVIQL